jgi:phosphatidylglycerol---prolipoprotein diacylglyceryl transferase
MFPIINLGPLAIQAPGLILLISLFLGIWLTGNLAKSLGTNGEAIENTLLIALIAGLISARIGFLLQNPDVFLENPLSIVSLTPSMLNRNFGILAGFLAGLISAQKSTLPLWPTLDTLTPLITLLFMGLHLANYASGNAFGLPTSLPWGVQLWGALRHPVQLYALFLSLCAFFWLWMRTKRLKITGFLQSGNLFFWVMTILAVITLLTRAFIAEKILLGQLDVMQLFAFILLVIFLGLLYRKMFILPKEVSAIISMGSNQKPQENLKQGLNQLSEKFSLKHASSIYQTADVRGNDTASFLNQVIEIATKKSFPDLRADLKSIESSLGREMGNKNLVPLDLDVLTYGKEVFTYKGYQVPSPDLIKYRYISTPLEEILPNFRHPANGKSMQQILKQTEDKSQVSKLKEVVNGSKR